jgi:outer membrane lipoprotein-sorting protein
MKRIRTGLITSFSVGLFLLCSSAFAAEFSADLVQSTKQGNLHGNVYIKGKKMRQEIEFPAVGIRNIIIVRADKGVVWTPAPGKKSYLEMPFSNNPQNLTGMEEKLEDIADMKFLGKEMINGYNCEKYRFKFHEPSMGTLMQWRSKRLNYPIKMKLDGPGYSITNEYRNIKEESLADSLFEMPPDYKKISMPSMPAGTTPPAK